MNRRFAFLGLAGLVIGASGVAQAASPMDAISWEPFDNPNFVGWHVGSSVGSASVGPEGLRLSTSPTIVGDYSIDDTIDEGDFFAAQVPFVTTGSAGSGGAVGFDITLQSQSDAAHHASIAWVNANNYVGALNGNYFVFGSNGTIGPLRTTLVTQGALGIIFSGGFINTYFNEGNGWQSLGTPTSTAGWVGPLVGSLTVSAIGVPSSFTAVVSGIQSSNTAPVPEPEANLMLVAGLILVGLSALRKKQLPA